MEPRSPAFRGSGGKTNPTSFALGTVDIVGGMARAPHTCSKPGEAELTPHRKIRSAHFKNVVYWLAIDSQQFNPNQGRPRLEQLATSSTSFGHPENDNTHHH